jgi:hypothetical protein
MESVYHIVAIRVNETSWAHVWRLRFRYLGKGYDKFHAYRTWLDEDAHAGSVQIASMEDCFAAHIVEFERTHQMRCFLRQKYESTGQSTYLAASRLE